MVRHVNEIIADFELLQMADFDMWNVDARGVERLDDLIEEIFQTPNPERAMNAMFCIMERLPDVDSETLSSLVHGIERLKSYEPRLVESVRRLPTLLSVWMVNRILNTLQCGEHREFLLAVLKEALIHPQINEETKESVLDFLKHQASKL